jgi:RNA recognition motif-containing protein
MGRKLYCGNLSFQVDNSGLEELFQSYGDVRSAQVVMDRDTGRSKGFGFVEMGSDSDAQAAIDGLHDAQFNGRALTVNEARPREERGGSYRSPSHSGYGDQGRSSYGGNASGGGNRDRY